MRTSPLGQPNISPVGNVQVDTSLRRGRVPELYLESNWETVRSPAIAEWSKTVHQRTWKRIDDEPRVDGQSGHGLLIMGPVGTGKSSAAALACRSAVEAGRSVVWAYVPEMISQMALGARERAEEIRLQSRTDLLVWDDFGVTDVADWEIGYLDQIVEARYRNRKPMIVTTNWKAEDLARETRMSRLVDRWRQQTCSSAVVLAGQSMRNR